MTHSITCGREDLLHWKRRGQWPALAPSRWPLPSSRARWTSRPRSLRTWTRTRSCARRPPSTSGQPPCPRQRPASLSGCSRCICVHACRPHISSTSSHRAVQHKLPICNDANSATQCSRHNRSACMHACMFTPSTLMPFPLMPFPPRNLTGPRTGHSIMVAKATHRGKANH